MSGERTDEAGSLGTCGFAAFENGGFGIAGTVTGFVAGFGTHHGGGAKFNDLDIGQDLRNLRADLAKPVDGGAVAAQSKDGINPAGLVEDSLGFVEVDPGGAVITKVSGRVGLGQGVGLTVEVDLISFFETERLVEVVSQIDRSGSERIHDGLLFGTVGDGDLSLDSDEEDGAVLLLPADSF